VGYPLLLVFRRRHSDDVRLMQGRWSTVSVNNESTDPSRAREIVAFNAARIGMPGSRRGGISKVVSD
jgi:hypothetical protein